MIVIEKPDKVLTKIDELQKKVDKLDDLAIHFEKIIADSDPVKKLIKRDRNLDSIEDNIEYTE